MAERGRVARGFVPSRAGRWLAVSVLSLLAIGGIATQGTAHSASSGPGAAPGPAVGTRLSTDAAPAPATDPGAPGLDLAVSPSRICAYAETACGAGQGTARVTLSATGASSPGSTWADVQIAFVIETTLYDGVYDASAGSPGSDACAESAEIACEESNGVPFFVANAGAIAEALDAEYPHSTISYAMVDYFATLTDHDDGDGEEYHVDLSNFLPGSELESGVQSTFQAEQLDGGWTYPDSDFSDNTLDSSSITALYGTIVGSDLDWSPLAHHVIVWMGSTAPRDPSYLEDYAVSSDYSSTNDAWSSPCEPSYDFSSGASPECEGWVQSHNGNPNDSIAALARSAPSCTDSPGGSCTIDTIDLWTTPTDPYSEGWPSGLSGGGPGGPLVLEDVDHVIAAGCDLAAATGGTWDGPSGYVCPDGAAGTLQYVDHGPPGAPNTDNPTLMAAFRNIGLGAGSLGGGSAPSLARPMFEYVPIGSIRLPSTEAMLSARTVCTHDGVEISTCPATPTIGSADGVSYLGWNWSSDPSENRLATGDSWSASFNVVASGPPYARVPVDACTTSACEAAGSGSVAGLSTSVAYGTSPGAAVSSLSFPLGTVVVVPVASPSTGGSAPGPAPPSAPGTAGIANPSPLGLVQPASVPAPTATGTVAVQALAAGVLGAGFLRVALPSRRVANPVLATKVPVVRSRFEETPRGDAPAGRWD